MRNSIICAFAMLLLISCGGENKSNSSDANINGEVVVGPIVTPPSEMVEPVGEVPNQPKVYSNAYDGFLNIRASASAKSNKIGELKNGPEGALVLSVEGKWTKVDLNGVVGFVNNAYVQSTPTEPAYIMPESVIGTWTNQEVAYSHYDDLIIFDNGTYTTYCDGFMEGSITSVGKWKLVRKDIVLTQYYDIVNEKKTFKTIRISVNPQTQILTKREDGQTTKYSRLKLISEKQVALESEEGYTPIWSKSQINNLKKDIKTYFK